MHHMNGGYQIRSKMKIDTLQGAQDLGLVGICQAFWSGQNNSNHTVMRLPSAVEPVDFRKGIDGQADLCRKILKEDRSATAVKILGGAYGNGGYRAGWPTRNGFAKGGYASVSDWGGIGILIKSIPSSFRVFSSSLVLTPLIFLGSAAP